MLGISLWSKNKKKQENFQNTFHGKSSTRLEKLKRRVLRTLKISGHKKEKYILLGCVLHSIQDYSAHSFVSDLEDYKKNRKKYLKAKDKLGKQYREENDPFQKQNAYNSDWEKGKRNVNEHKKNKDNPLKHFRYDFNLRKWYWVDVGSSENNPRYKMAREETKKYLKLTINYIK